MANVSIYSHFTETKSNSTIPVLNSGRTVESKYNPEREAENLIQNLDKPYNAFLILGISSGILLDKLHEHFPQALLISVEISEADIKFLKENESIKSNISKSKSIISSITNMEEVLVSNYLPAKYGDLKIIEQQNWLNENHEYIPQITENIQKALKRISADFSVQSHFGKIWTSNILNNLKLLSKTKSSLFENEIDKSKTAYIIAAGPSLDKKLQKLKTAENAFIIATDTSFQTLQKYKISPDIVVSIDGQNISYNHFSNSRNYINTLFMFSLSGDFSAANYIYKNNLKLNYFVTANPLELYFNRYINYSLPQLFSGAGTVTISALDLAIQLGFRSIKILGADFSYSEGKAYTKGTYLDLLYNYKSNKIFNNESTFDKLLFRTELIKENNSFKTQILDSYKNSLIDYLNSKKLIFSYDDFEYSIVNSNENYLYKNFDFDYQDFINELVSSPVENIEPVLLPLISYLRKENNYSNMDYSDFLKLAQSFIVRYN